MRRAFGQTPTGERPGDGTQNIWAGTTLEQRQRVRRTALLEAALDMIGESGAAAVSMRALCRRTGLTTRYFYENFATTDELLAAAYREVSREFYEVMTAYDPGATASPERALAALLVEEVLRDPRKSRLFLIEPYSGTTLGAVTVSAMPSFTRWIRDTLLTESADPARRELAAVSVASGVAGMLSAWLNGTLRATREQVVEHVAQSLLTYTRACADHPAPARSTAAAEPPAADN